MITIKIPPTYEIERRYILKVMFTEFLGLDIDIKQDDCVNTLISYEDRELLIADGLFKTPLAQWLNFASLPQQPLAIWDLATTKLNPTTVNRQIPIIYGDNPHDPNFFIHNESKIYLGLDLFGSAFFMLTRYEEVVKIERDRDDRFPATASLAYQENFLDRPIINEYLEILWDCLQSLWPELKRRSRQFQLYLSHDVDRPFMYAFTGISSLIKRCGGDIFRRYSLIKATQSISAWMQVKRGNSVADPCNTFDLIMDISEQHNLKSAFYFITAHSGDAIDGDYTMNHPLIRSLLVKIHDRGHEIGLHPSYNTYKDAAQTKKEFEILKQVCDELGIHQAIWGGRQHYLRWENPTTFQNWEDAGLNYDSSLSFADLAGFRSGICYEYSTFNIKTRQTLKLKERPLIMMECTILATEFMNLPIDDDATFQRMAKYKQTCQLFQGDFRLLWHNSNLLDPQGIAIYKQLVAI